MKLTFYSASSGLWKTYQLQKQASGWEAASISTPLNLQSLTFTAPRPGGLITAQELSLLPIHSSLVLLAAIPTSPLTDIVLAHLGPPILRPPRFTLVHYAVNTLPFRYGRDQDRVGQVYRRSGHLDAFT
jgi:hypothetical protein